MRTGELESEAKQAKAKAKEELSKLERVASKADELLGGAFMMGRSTKLGKTNMGPQKLARRISGIKGAQKLGNALVMSLRASNESEVHIEAEVHEQLVQAKETGEYESMMLYAVNSARSEWLGEGKVALGPGSIADFEYGGYGKHLNELLDEANKIAAERKIRIDKISREQEVTESEKMGYMVVSTILGELKSDAKTLRKEVLTGRVIYEKSVMVMEYLGERPILYADPFGRQPEEAVRDFMGRIDMIGVDSLMEEVDGGQELISAVYMLIGQAANDTAARKRGRSLPPYQ
ncbi:MAG: hypothetical protein KGH57_01230 [Candidatus Micrarchaeota archaeon]|nr:hypothetical protein [Candidatus Micrarchaeota archaeon]